jgi:4-hydroxy 2-oxovalerate aldolase
MKAKRILNAKYNIEYYIHMELLDCTLRDGGYTNNWSYTDEFVKQYYKTANECNIDYVEIGFYNKKLDYKDVSVGKWYNLDNDIVNSLSLKGNTKLCAMIDNANKDLATITPAKDSPISMFRVAFHKKESTDALKFCNHLKNLGYTVCANAMATQNYDVNEQEQLIKSIIDNNIDYLYIADSYGCLYPSDLVTILQNYKNLRHKYNGHFKIGTHLHNNLDNALANAIACIDNDIDIIDSTLFGMGRGAGNLTTESLTSYLLKKNIRPDLQLLPLLTFIQDHVLVYYNNNTFTSWGYNILYVLSAFYKVHPNYINKLIDLKVTNVREVDKILRTLVELDQHMYFNKALHLKELAIA